MGVNRKEEGQRVDRKGRWKRQDGNRFQETRTETERKGCKQESIELQRGAEGTGGPLPLAL